MNFNKEQLESEVSRFLGELFKGTGLDLDFRCEPEDHTMTVWLSGQDAPMAVSNDTRLLYAINHLLNRAFYEKSPQQWNFMVDYNEYRAARGKSQAFRQSPSTETDACQRAARHPSGIGPGTWHQYGKRGGW